MCMEKPIKLKFSMQVSLAYSKKQCKFHEDFFSYYFVLSMKSFRKSHFPDSQDEWSTDFQLTHFQTIFDTLTRTHSAQNTRVSANIRLLAVAQSFIKSFNLIRSFSQSLRYTIHYLFTKPNHCIFLYSMKHV